MEEARAVAYRRHRLARRAWQDRLDAALEGSAAAARDLRQEWQPVTDRFATLVEDDTDPVDDPNRADRA